MNEMRKLMESVERINENWDVKGIAKAIHDEWSDEGSPISRAAKKSVEPFRAAMYEFGYSSGLFNPDTLDGSEIWHDIIDELERLNSATIDEAYDEEVDGPVPSGNSDAVLRELVRELQVLERNTARVFTEITRSRNRADFTKFVVNEFSETLTEITDLVEKYEDLG